jgi:hypothetical protein
MESEDGQIIAGGRKEGGRNEVKGKASGRNWPNNVRTFLCINVSE